MLETQYNTDDGIPAAHRPAVLEQFATRIVFFVLGFTIGSWAPLVPLVQAKIGLNNGQLGTVLLCVGLGSVTTMPFAGGLAARFGCRKTILVAGISACLSFPLMAAAHTASPLAIALLLFGAGVGTADVVVNIQASLVEKASGRSMMSGFHGMYSVGGIAGAGAMTGLLSLGLSPQLSAVGIAALSFLLLIGFSRGLLPYGSAEKSPPFALPKGRVLLIGALCFVMFLAEGAVLDWSGVLLRTVRGVEKNWAGLGYAAFSAMMTIGRLSGDRVVHWLGPRRILLFGGICAAVGFMLAAAVPAWPVAVLGFALVGTGAANVVPVLISAAGRQTWIPINQALATVTTMGYTGILSGPAFIGLMAHALTLPIALFIVALLLAGVAMLSRVVIPE